MAISNCVVANLVSHKNGDYLVLSEDAYGAWQDEVNDNYSSMQYKYIRQSYVDIARLIFWIGNAKYRQSFANDFIWYPRDR